MSNPDKTALTEKESENLHNNESLQGSLNILISKFMPLLREIKNSLGEIEPLKKAVGAFSTDLPLLLTNRADKITHLMSTQLGAPSPQIDSLSTKVESLLAQIATLTSKVDEVVNKQGEQFNKISSALAEIPNKLDYMKSSLDKVVSFETRINEIQQEQDEIKTIVDAIYKPPEPVSAGNVTIHRIKLPAVPPKFKLQADKASLISHLKNFKENIVKEGLIGSDINEACSTARDGIVQTLLQRGPLVQFFSQLQDSLKPMFREVLPASYKTLISEEISKAIEFYESAPVKEG